MCTQTPPELEKSQIGVKRRKTDRRESGFAFGFAVAVFVLRCTPNEDWWARRDSNPQALSGSRF